MRTPLALSLLTLIPVTLAAQGTPSVTPSLGMATAYGGSGPSGSVRLEVPLANLSESVALVAGGTGWLAQTDVAGSRWSIKRNTKGVGPQIGLQWRPGNTAWRLTLGGGVEYLWNRNDDPTIACAPPDDCGGSAPDHSRHNARRSGVGGVIATRLTLPPQAGATIEFGASATRHALFEEAAWWHRFEVGVRLGGGSLASERASLATQHRLLGMPPQRRRMPRWVAGGIIGGAVGAGLMLGLVSLFDSADHGEQSYLAGAGIGAFGGFVLGALIAGE